MSQEQTKKQSNSREMQSRTLWADSHYAILGLNPYASALDIRRAYRELSKQYHPDTTNLPPEIATTKFQRLNEAYATLSNPERRSLYDLSLGYSRWNVIQPPPDMVNYAKNEQKWSNSAYLDPTDRPLSAGEIFVLFILGLTFIGCLLLVMAIAFFRGEQLTPSPELSLIISMFNF